MLESVRIRLTLWGVAVLAVLLTAFGAGVYVLTSRSLYDRLDAGLNEVLDITAASFTHEAEEHRGKSQAEDGLRTILQAMATQSFPTHGIAVYEGSRMVASKAGPAGFVPALPSVPGRNIWTSGIHRIRYRTVRVPAIGASYTLIAGHSAAGVREQVAALGRVLLLTIPVFLAAAAAGGYLLARKSLAPVVAMSETVDRISSRSLEQRVPVANPKDELGRLALTFNRLLARLHASFEQQRQFMADASHELRTPVSIALTASQVTLGSRTAAESDYRDALEVIEQQMTRLTHVVRDMMTLAVADTGAYTPKCERFYADELIEGTARAARVLAQKKRIELTWSAEPEVLLNADEGLVRQAVMILLDNAIKYTPEGGTVHLSLAVSGGDANRPGSVALIAVADNGPGITPELRDNIFDRFVRVDKARSRSSAGQTGGGAGLGLAIGKWIAESHGGRLELTRSDAEGSTFTLVLPGATRAAAASEAAAIMRTSSN